MKHYFLGTAAGWSKAERIAQRKAHGDRVDLLKLYDFLGEHYGGKRVLVTKNGRSAIAAGLVYGLETGKTRDGKDVGQAKNDGLERGEVIVNGFTCRAVVQGVKAAGMTPVYADISPETLNFTLESLEKVVTGKTRAIIVQNTLGNMVKIEEILKFAKKYKLMVMEDLAHSAGRKYADGREAGMVGDVTVLSFGKEKAIDVINGGAVIFRKTAPEVVVPEKQPSDREEFRARAYPTIGAIYRALSYVGLNGVFMRMMLGLGWVEKSAEGEVDFTEETLSYFQAKLVLAKLKRMSEKPVREFYLVRDRDEVLKKMRKAGYYFEGFWYETPVAPERYYKQADFPEKKCPNAVFVARHIINFPSYYSKQELRRAREIVEPEIIKEEEIK